MIKDLPSFLAGTLMVLVFGVLVTGAQSGGSPESPAASSQNAQPAPSPAPDNPLVAWSRADKSTGTRHLQP